LTPDLTGDGRPDVIVGAPDQTVNKLRNAGRVYVFSGASGDLVRTVTSAVPTAVAGFGFTVNTADFNGDGVFETVVGTPFQDAELMDPDGDIVTHLQIGQIEIQ
jgi:hypothetical protein